MAAAEVTAGSEALGVDRVAVAVFEAVFASTCATADVLSEFVAHNSKSARWRLVILFSVTTRGGGGGGDDDDDDKTKVDDIF